MKYLDPGVETKKLPLMFKINIVKNNKIVNQYFNPKCLVILLRIWKINKTNNTVKNKTNI